MAITNARMQIKRGNEVDFDAEKMLVGEWALSTDKRIVRICVAPNVCIRMATYDAFEVDMAQIEKILEECRTIEDVVKLINSQVSEKLELTIEYTNQAKQYRDETEQFRNEVESMVDIGIATTEKAGIVKPDGTTIRVDEDGTIHADNGTVDYNELENKPSINGMELSGDKSLDELGIASVEALEETNYKVDTILEKAGLTLKNTASGSLIHLTDSANGKNVGFGLYGKAEQKQYSGKNLLQNTAISQTVNGVTFTVNEDGSVKLAETCTGSELVYLNNNILLEDGSYIASVGENIRLRILGYSSSWVELGNSSNGLVAFNAVSETYSKYMLQVGIESGKTYNTTIYPMIRLASITDGTYEPFVGGIPSPNPDYPQEITVAGASGSVEVVSCGKNVIDQICVPILDSQAKTHFLKAGVYTIARDSVENGKIWFFGAFDGNGSVITESAMQAQSCALNGSKEYYYGAENLDTTKITLNVDCYFKVGVLNSLGTTYFMMSKGDKYEPYEPYKETTSTIPTPDGLCGIKVASGGNYTDENGQQWICDEVVKYADGSGKRVQRIGKDVFDGSDDEGWERYTPYECFNTRKSDKALKTMNGMCSHYKAITTTWTDFINNSNVVFFADNSSLIRFKDSKIDNVSDWKEKLSNEPIEILYILAEPIITDLSAEEIAEIEKLHTFYPVTNISNDADCGMILAYFSTKLEFLEPKTDWTKNDAFDYVAYNRVTNNIMYLKELANYLFSSLANFSLEMEKDNLSLIYARHMNAIENGLEKINSVSYKIDIGNTKNYKPNGNVPNYEEYNRIESACLALYNEMQIHKNNLPKLAIRLGNQKGIRV